MQDTLRFGATAGPSSMRNIPLRVSTSRGIHSYQMPKSSSPQGEWKRAVIGLPNLDYDLLSLFPPSPPHCTVQLTVTLPTSHASCDKHAITAILSTTHCFCEEHTVTADRYIHTFAKGPTLLTKRETSKWPILTSPLATTCTGDRAENGAAASCVSSPCVSSSKGSIPCL